MRIPDATERKVLIGCIASAAVLCAAPGDFVSSGALALSAIALWVIHWRLLRSEGGGAV